MDNVIYHYTNINALINILSLEKISLWATNASYLNDPNEIVEGTHIVNKIENENIHPGSFCNYYISSFSKDEDSLVMWSQYAANGCGCALGLDMNIITQSYTFMAACTYGEEETAKHFSDFSRLNKTGKQIILGGPQLTKEQIARNKAIDRENLLIQTCLSAKNIAYKHENEFRGIIYESNPQNIKFRQVRNYIAPYVVVDIPKNALKRIIIGPNANEDIVMQSIYHMLKLKQYNYKDNVCNSKVPFRG